MTSADGRCSESLGLVLIFEFGGEEGGMWDVGIPTSRTITLPSSVKSTIVISYLEKDMNNPLRH